MRKIIIGALIVIAVVIIGSIIYSLIPKTQLHLVVAPLEVEMSIDGGPLKNVRNEQDITVSPGEHTIRITRAEFEEYTTKINFEENEKTEVMVALVPLTPAAEEQLLDPKAEEIVQRFKGKAFNVVEDAAAKDFPIAKDLPIEARLYMVSACPSQKFPDDKTKLALCAYLYHVGLEDYVKKHIQSLGYNPDDYELIFVTRYEDE